MKPPLVSTEAIAAILNEKPRTINSWCGARKIPFVKIGHRTRRFDPEKVRAALDRFEIKAA